MAANKCNFRESCDFRWQTSIVIRNLSVRRDTTKGEDDEGMNDAYVYVRDLRQQAKVPENGILSQTLQNDDSTKVMLFGLRLGKNFPRTPLPFRPC
jgi:hypothetical protein